MVWLLRLVGLLVVVLGVGVGASLWRLAQGPVALDPLIPWVEQALGNADRRITVTIGGLVLAWTDDAGDGRSTLDLRALRVAAVNSDGVPLATVPELGVSFSVAEAVMGRLSPTRFTAIRPQVTVVRHADGSVGFDLRGDEAAGRAEPAPEAGSPLAEDALAALSAPPRAGYPLGLLRRLSMVGGTLTVRNEQHGGEWRASPADIVLERDRDGLRGQGRLTVDLGGTSAALAADVVYRRADATTTIGFRGEGVELSRLAPIAPVLAPLAGIAVPVGGRVEADLDAGFQPARIRFDMTAGAGAVALPWRTEGQAPLALRNAAVRGSLDLADGKAAVDRAVVETAEGVRLSLSGHVAGSRPAPSGSFPPNLSGTAIADLTIGGDTATVQLAADPDGTGTRITMGLTNLTPARLAALDPLLEPLAAAALPLAGQVRVGLGPDHRPVTVGADLTAGAGRVTVPDRFDAPLDIAHAALRGEAALDGSSASLDALTIAFGRHGQPGPEIRAAAALAPAADGSGIAVASVTASHLPLDDLHRYWPKGLSHNARDWVTANISNGMAEEAGVAVSLGLPSGGPAAGGPVRVNTLEGTIRVQGADVAYFRPLPPVTGVEDVEVRFDQKRFAIRTRGGSVGDVQIGETDILLDDLDTDNEKIAIRVPLTGPVRSILTILDNPPLGYPKKLDMDPAGTAGTAEGVLDIAFPLLADLPMDRIDVKAAANLKGAAVKKVAAGMDASDGTLALDLDMKGMGLKGTVKLDGIPATVEWRESFEDKPKGPRTRVAVKARADASALSHKLFDPVPYATGPLGADLVFTIDAQRRFGMTVALDLTPTTLAIDELGWGKAAGAAAAARFKVEFQKDRVTRLTGLTAEGVGLKAAGTVEFAPGTSALSRVVLSDVMLGRSHMRGTMSVRGDGYVFDMTGPVLDAAPALKDGDESAQTEDGSATPAAPPPRRRPVEIKGRFDRVLFGDWRQLTNLTATARNDGNAWTLLDIKANAGGPKGGLSVQYGPDKGRYALRITAGDMGRALQMTDLNDRVREGALSVTGTTEGAAADSPLAGHITITDYRLVDTPVLAGILNAMSLGGLVDLLKGEGISFGKLEGDFRKAGRVLAVKNVRTSGSALGLTLEGQVDVKTNVANLQGTIVPIYGLNRLIGQIPILGDLLSGGEGQGIFSATWHVTGPLGDPKISVNPLAVLAPGFLRNLFFLGDGEGGGDESRQPAPNKPASGWDHTR